MGSESFKFICTTTLFIIFLLSYPAFSSSSHSSTQEIQPLSNPSSSSSTTTTPSHYLQVFHLKNTPDSTSLTKQERFKKRRMIKRNKNMMVKHRKEMIKNTQQSRSFSVMLPKGFVPPSGSSPCHNYQPNSVSSFHCHLSATAEQP